jgi:DNA replication protein DnaC
MMSVEEKMHRLRLGGMAKRWREVKYKSTEKYIDELLEMELAEREINTINRRIKNAKFSVIKTLDEFVWHTGIQIPDGITQESIENFDFVGKKENLIFLGGVGTGKTHLAAAVTLNACKNGKSARFFTAAELANLLIDRNQKSALRGFFEEIKKFDLIVIDEIGFVPLHKEAAGLMFQILSLCYEKCSLIITSNLEFSQWNTLFGDNRLTAALIDRLIHHSHILIFSGESFRLKQSLSNLKSSGK